MANITFYSLSDYNKGDLIARTFDLDLFPSYEELSEARTEWLEELTENLDDGELREEFIVADYEGIPSNLVGEWDISQDFGEWLEAVEEHGEDIVLAAVELDIPLDKIADAYAGEARDDEEFAERLAEDIGLLDGMPDHLRCYFDMEAFARDLMITDYSEENGHYFRTDW